MKTPVRVTIFAAIFAAIDQVSKFLAIDIIGKERFEYFNGIFHFEIHGNTGVAFGLPIPFPIIVVLNITLLITLIYYFKKETKIKKPLTQILLSMILGGAIANLIDRFVHGSVVDFIGVSIWPYFNFADAFIVTAILLLFVFHGKINRVTHSHGNRKSD